MIGACAGALATTVVGLPALHSGSAGADHVGSVPAKDFGQKTFEGHPQSVKLMPVIKVKPAPGIKRPA